MTESVFSRERNSTQLILIREDGIIRQKGHDSTKSEYELILEFIGYRNLMILGLIGGFYFVSGFKNYVGGMHFLDSFNPYYALHFHDGARLIDNSNRAFWGWMSDILQTIGHFFSLVKDRVIQFLETYFKPFFHDHPLIGLIVFISIGFLTTIFLLATFLLLIKKTIHLLALGSVVALPGSRHAIQTEEIWAFDPHRKPSEEQLKITQKNLEKLVQRAPVLGGHVPKNADTSLRELAKRNKDSEYNYRNAIYVMGPIKGTKFDNQYEIPIALDQVKKISNMMGLAAEYETIPLDLVILRCKKGVSTWEVESSIAPVSLGKQFPVKIIEKVMIQHLNSFIWDQRVSKSRTGYGAH